MIKKSLLINVDGKKYPAEFTFKKMKNIRYHFSQGVLMISAPLILQKDPEKIIERLVIKGRFKKKLQVLPSPVQDGLIYILGELVPLSTITKSDNLNLQQAYPPVLKHILLDYLKQRVPEIMRMMHISTTHSFIVRDMKTRFGTNSRSTQRLAFTSRLVHFSPAIIDSVIIHELAHDYYFDHSPAFYQVVKTYCPAYYQYRKALIKQQYAL